MFGISNDHPLIYEVQAHPQRPGLAIVTVRDAIHQQTDGLWTYDEYTRDVPYTGDLSQQIGRNIQEWIDNLRTCDPTYEVRKNAEETIDELDAAIVDYAYQNALLKLGLSEV